MVSARRWWTRYTLRLVWAGLVLAAAWYLRQTHGALVVEFYARLVRPLQGDPTLSVEQLTHKRIEELEDRVKELEQQNRQLKTLLGYVEPRQPAAIAAPIIGRSPDDWWQQVILGRGSQDGITQDSIVKGIGGLVGRVSEVTPHSSRVSLLSNPDSRVGAMVSRSRAMGILKGQGSQFAAMEFLEKVPDVRPGDTIVTSSVSRKFPPGLPIGRVQSVNLESNPAPQAKVVLTAPINNLEWASVQPLPPQAKEQE